ncbi:2Fe-2S iron-sulfur cluster-binding protein [Spongiibacter sp.]|uniref:2Fe-2S iron-sulfur cluster-binding protein n=1 Tax=Spongiibacter sp. TaxID=2024860 RepID=UPI003565AE26
MVAITYVEHDGTEHVVEVDEQMSLMEGATLNMVPGVEGMCGGICSCATCHCYIREEWRDKMPAMSDGESTMLENAIDRRANSRLGCQISVTPEMDGMRVELPQEQA